MGTRSWRSNRGGNVRWAGASEPTTVGKVVGTNVVGVGVGLATGLLLGVTVGSNVGFWVGPSREGRVERANPRGRAEGAPDPIEWAKPSVTIPVR